MSLFPTSYEVVDPPQCLSEDNCKLVNSFLDDDPTEQEYYDRIDVIKQRIIDNDILIEKLKVGMNDRIEETSKLKEMLLNNYNEVWKLYGKYKYMNNSL